MKKKNEAEPDTTEMPELTDFRNAVRGKYIDRLSPKIQMTTFSAEVTSKKAFSDEVQRIAFSFAPMDFVPLEPGPWKLLVNSGR